VIGTAITALPSATVFGVTAPVSLSSRSRDRACLRAYCRTIQFTSWGVAFTASGLRPGGLRIVRGVGAAAFGIGRRQCMYRRTKISARKWQWHSKCPPGNTWSQSSAGPSPTLVKSAFSARARRTQTGTHRYHLLLAPQAAPRPLRLARISIKVSCSWRRALDAFHRAARRSRYPQPAAGGQW
jgi:hypothetical protein